MKCQMTMNDPTSKPLGCRQDCAWLVENQAGTCACAIAFLASKEAFGYAVKNIIERGA